MEDLVISWAALCIGAIIGAVKFIKAFEAADEARRAEREWAREMDVFIYR